MAINTPSSSRPYYIHSDGTICYIDWQKLEYNESSNTAKIAVFACNKQGQKISASTYSIDFSNKPYNELYNVNYMNPKQSLKDKFKNQAISIPPDTPVEVLANLVATHLKLPRIYSGGPSRWKQLPSTQIYISQNCLRYNAQTDTCLVWLKSDISGIGTVVSYHVCDFKNDVIRKDAPYGMDDFLTATEKIIIQTAKSLCEQQGLRQNRK